MKNGFIFLETIIVMSVLSLTLMLLFSSYSFILNKTKERNTYDTVEMTYKTYYIDKIIKNVSGLTVDNYIKTAPECKKICGSNDACGSGCGYVCNIEENSGFFQIKYAFEVDKIYYVNPFELNNYTFGNGTKIKKENDKLCNDWMLKFDATTIDYLKSMGKTINKPLMVVKYKKTYRKGDTYEVFHSSNAGLIT